MFAKKFRVCDKAEEVSYAVAEIVAWKMKSHTIAQSIILRAFQEMVRIMVVEEAVSEVNKIPLSDETICWCIQDRSGDIQCYITSKVHKQELFSLHVDESTDMTSKGQLHPFFRFVNTGAIAEDSLSCKELPELMKGQDGFNI